MSQLSSFDTQEIELLVSLPYQAGIHVSYAEDEEGEGDDEYEMEALESAVLEVAKRHEKSDLVREVAQEILKRRDEWPQWSEHVFNLDQKCKQAVLLLNGRVSLDEARAYRSFVLDIATSVAQAYGEFGLGAVKKSGISGLIKKIIGKDTSIAGHPMNMSAAEDSAIKALAAAMKI